MRAVVSTRVCDSGNKPPSAQPSYISHGRADVLSVVAGELSSRSATTVLRRRIEEGPGGIEECVRRSGLRRPAGPTFNIVLVFGPDRRLSQSPTGLLAAILRQGRPKTFMTREESKMQGPGIKDHDRPTQSRKKPRRGRAKG